MSITPSQNFTNQNMTGITMANPAIVLALVLRTTDFLSTYFTAKYDPSQREIRKIIREKMTCTDTGILAGK